MQETIAKRINKPWGYELIWAHTESYVGKLLHINAGHRLSKQYHEEKEETLYVLKGILDLELDGSKRHVSPGEFFHIKPGVIHRFAANEADVELMEVSTTQLDDVIRVEDDYNRES